MKTYLDLNKVLQKIFIFKSANPDNQLMEVGIFLFHFVLGKEVRRTKMCLELYRIRTPLP